MVYLMRGPTKFQMSRQHFIIDIVILHGLFNARAYKVSDNIDKKL